MIAGRLGKGTLWFQPHQLQLGERGRGNPPRRPQTEGWLGLLSTLLSGTYSGGYVAY